MIKRVLSIMFLVLFIPILYIGGNIFTLFVYLFSLIGISEFIKVKDIKKEVPIFIKMISYFTVTFLFFSHNISYLYSIDYCVLASIFALFLIPTIVYHDRNLYSVNDAFYFIGGILFLGISFNLFRVTRMFDLRISIYLLLISVCSEVYAFITGKLIGKHFLKVISPSKTFEGIVGGLIFGTFIPVMYYFCFIDFDVKFIFITLFLCVLGIVGDLCFSSIKRYFGVKDFSSFLPYYGGVLDLFDSIIFILLGFTFFVNIGCASSVLNI